jgi:hypothetical protein
MACRCCCCCCCCWRWHGLGICLQAGGLQRWLGAPQAPHADERPAAGAKEWRCSPAPTRGRGVHGGAAQRRCLHGCESAPQHAAALRECVQAPPHPRLATCLRCCCSLECPAPAPGRRSRGSRPTSKRAAPRWTRPPCTTPGSAPPWSWLSGSGRPSSSARCAMQRVRHRHLTPPPTSLPRLRLAQGAAPPLFVSLRSWPLKSCGESRKSPISLQLMVLSVTECCTVCHTVFWSDSTNATHLPVVHSAVDVHCCAGDGCEHDSAPQQSSTGRAASSFRQYIGANGDAPLMRVHVPHTSTTGCCRWTASILCCSRC